MDDASKFNRPKVYKADIANETLAKLEKEMQMKKDLGFESDEEVTNEEANPSVNTMLQEKIDELEEKLKTEKGEKKLVVSQYKATTEELTKMKDRLSNFEQMSKSQVQILKNSYQTQLQTKDRMIQELRDIVKEDEEQIAALEKGQDGQESEKSASELTRELKRLKAEYQYLKEEKEELESQGAQGHTGVASTGKSTPSALDKFRSPKPSSDGGETIESTPDKSTPIIDEEIETKLKTVTKDNKVLEKKLKAAKDAYTTLRENALQLNAASEEQKKEILALKQENEELKRMNDEIGEEAEKMVASNADAASSAELEEVKQQLRDCKTQLQESQSALAQAQQDANAAMDEHIRAQAQSEASISSLKTALSSQAGVYSTIKSKISPIRDSWKGLREEAKKWLSGFDVDTAKLNKAFKFLGDETQKSIDRYKKEMKERKKLFNLVQELRGNIRVFCRVRPPGDGRDISDVVNFPDEGQISIFNEGTSNLKTFEFDNVFTNLSTQAQVFEDTEPLITSVLDGYNVCIFAYGQTGSGKTFTMEGPKSNPGVNTRALAELFRLRESRTEEFEYELSVSLLEIYNEKIRDLLADPSQAATNLDVKQGKDGMYVPDLNIVPVSSQEEVEEVMKFGHGNRAVGTTNMNLHSSRSHAILSIYASGKNKITGLKTSAKLHLVDLAGSERLSKSNAEGQTLVEAQNINKSLSALGDVIQSLGQKTSHVPYRNSKLTYLLQDSLGGNSKTLMMVQVAPESEHCGETLCSLNFAARVKTVELGKATKNVDKGGSRRR